MSTRIFALTYPKLMNQAIAQGRCTGPKGCPFSATSEKQLWHAIYSETNRFSVGYRVTLQPSFLNRVKHRVKSRLVRIFAS